MTHGTSRPALRKGRGSDLFGEIAGSGIPAVLAITTGQVRG
jgi:hypothetical protein